MPSNPEVCLLEGLMPPDGFELESIVGTTYNLSPSVILSILVAASVNGASTPQFALEERSKEEILNAISANKEKCVFFCDHHDKLDGKRPFTSHQHLILDSVIKSEGRSNNLAGSLHSKLLLILFKNPKGEHLGKVFIGSKNLTETNFTEFGIVLDLVSSKKKQKSFFVDQLTQYLLYLEKYESKNVNHIQKLQPLKRAISILKQYKLRPTIPNLNLHWQGRNLLPGTFPNWKSLATSSKKWLTSKPQDVYIHSPWSRAAAVSHLMQLGNDKTKYFIQCLNEPRLSTVQSKQVSYKFYHGANDRLQANSSHAKIYLFRMNREALIAFGSANCTSDAWGLRTDTKARSNSELLITMKGSFQEFKYLANICGVNEVDLSPSKRDEDVSEKILNYLSSIRSEISYDTASGQLVYNFESEARRPIEVGNLEIIQTLIEPHDGQSTIKLYSGQKFPKTCKKKWAEKSIYLISPLLTFRDSRSSEEVDLILDLDLKFFAGREKLKCLTFTPQEFIESLSQLMEIPFEGINKNRGDTREDLENSISKFLSSLRIERYAYRMARLKRSSPAEFKNRLRRIEQLLKSHSSNAVAISDLFLSAINEIRRCHRVLNEA